MSKPLRDYGSSPLDTIRRTLSLQLRAILFEEGLVDSPDLPLRPLPAEVVATDSAPHTLDTLAASLAAFSLDEKESA